MPMAATSLASFSSSSMDNRDWPGIEAIGSRIAATVDDEDRIDQIVHRQPRLAHQRAQQRLLPQAARAEHPLSHH